MDFTWSFKYFSFKYKFYFLMKKPEFKNTDLVRLNKFISNSGVCSRREADSHISMGMVTVNGKTVTQMGYKINLNDKIRYDGQIIQAEKPEYFILNKPKGFIADLKKKKITKSVDELIKLNFNNKLFFEQMSRICSGLLFFTNDLRLKNKIINSKKIEMVYHVKFDKTITELNLNQIRKKNNYLKDKFKFESINQIGNKFKKEFGVKVYSTSPITLIKFFSIHNLNVQQIDRVIYGPITKKKLPRGKWRRLEKSEISLMNML